MLSLSIHEAESWSIQKVAKLEMLDPLVGKKNATAPTWALFNLGLHRLLLGSLHVSTEVAIFWWRPLKLPLLQVPKSAMGKPRFQPHVAVGQKEGDPKMACPGT